MRDVWKKRNEELNMSEIGCDLSFLTLRMMNNIKIARVQL